MKAVSIISIVYGAIGLIWATVISVVIRVSGALFEHFPWPPEVSEVIDMPAVLDSVYGLIGNIFPFVFLIAALYIISGILYLAGKASYKNIAYAAAILNILWYVVYMVLVQVEIVPVLNTMELFPKNLLACDGCPRYDHQCRVLLRLSDIPDHLCQKGRQGMGHPGYRI